MADTSPLYLADLADCNVDALHEHIVRSYETTPDSIGTVLVAYESVGNYGCDSASYFLIQRDDELFEVHGSHCSCYGFEGQWEPKPVTVKYILSDRWYVSCGGYDAGTDRMAQIRDYVRQRFDCPAEITTPASE